MKAKVIAYWVATALLSLMMTASAAMYLSGAPAMREGFERLGYPGYFRVVLGVAKLLGVVVLLAPGLPVLKEWAYAGFTFTFVAALVSHLAVNDGDAGAPVVAAVLLAISYATRPAGRRVPASTDLAAEPQPLQVPDAPAVSR